MNTLLIILGILLGIVLIYGVYKLATARFRENSSLKPSSETTPRRTIQTIFTILISIILIIAVIFAYRYFTTL